MRSKQVIIKSFCVVILLTLLLQIAGCSGYFVAFAKAKITRDVEEFIESSEKDLEKALRDYSTEEIQFRKMDDELFEIFMDYGKGSLSLVDIEVGEDFDTATVSFKVVYLKLTDDYGVYTIDDCIEYLEDSKVKNKIIDVEMYLDDREWKFEDLNRIYELVFDPYSEIVLVDDMGIPYNASPEFFCSHFVEAAWYDPVTSIPMQDNYLVDPIAIQAAFYFDMLMNGEVEAVLYDQDGDEVARKTYILDKSVFVKPDFSLNYVGLDYFEGSYSVSLYYDNELIGTTSEDIEIR